MPLKVEILLGTSALCDAVIKALEGIDGLESVRVGPAVAQFPLPALTCTDEGDYLKLIVPITNGCRVFLIEHYTGRVETGTAVQQLTEKILSQIKRATLPPEIAEDEARPGQRPSRTKPKPPSGRSRKAWRFTATTDTLPAPLPALPPPAIIVEPDPAFEPESTYPSVLNPETALAMADVWADDQSGVTGLMTKLLSHFGGEEAAVNRVVLDLIDRGQIIFLGPTSVYENYQKYRIVRT